VPGTVNMDSLTYSGSSVGYSYNSYDTNSLTSVGTIPLGTGPIDALSPSGQEFFDQMSARRQASNGAIAAFAGADALFAASFASTYAIPAAIGALTAAGETGAIQFGKGANQVYHALRHLKEEGVNVQAAKDAILNDIAGKGALPQGLTTGTVNVGGRALNYNAYKLADGTINVGSIRVK
jgi:hypothetical protein